MRRLMWKFLPGYVTITLEGVYLDVFLNEIRKTHRIRAVKRHGHTHLTVTVRARERDAILCAAHGRGIRCTAAGEDAFVRLSAGMFRKWWITLAAGVLLTGMLLLSHCCLRIDWIGNETLSDFALTALLEQNGITAGIPKRDVDLNAVKNLLYREYPALSYVEAHFAGTTLEIILQEGTPKPQILSTEPCSVAAEKRGVLLRLTVGEGEANAQVGAIVEAGDILIRGDYTKKEHEFRVHARGTALAQVDYIAKTTMSLEEGLVRTGNTATQRCLEFWGLNISLSGENPFALYETSRAVIATVPENMPVFLRVTETTYYECVRGVSADVRRIAEQRLREEAYYRALSDVPRDAELLDFYSVVTERAGELTATATVTVKEEIGTEVPIVNTEGEDFGIQA